MSPLRKRHPPRRMRRPPRRNPQGGRATARHPWVTLLGTSQRPGRCAMASQPAECESCHTALIFALTRNRKMMPLDRDPHPEGNVAAYQDELGVWHARVLGRGQEPDAALTEHRYMPHF